MPESEITSPVENSVTATIAELIRFRIKLAAGQRKNNPPRLGKERLSKTTLPQSAQDFLNSKLWVDVDSKKFTPAATVKTFIVPTGEEEKGPAFNTFFHAQLEVLQKRYGKYPISDTPQQENKYLEKEIVEALFTNMYTLATNPDPRKNKIAYIFSPTFEAEELTGIFNETNTRAADMYLKYKATKTEVKQVGPPNHFRGPDLKIRHR